MRYEEFFCARGDEAACMAIDQSKKYIAFHNETDETSFRHWAGRLGAADRARTTREAPLTGPVGIAVPRHEFGMEIGRRCADFTKRSRTTAAVAKRPLKMDGAGIRGIAGLGKTNCAVTCNSEESKEGGKPFNG